MAEVGSKPIATMILSYLARRTCPRHSVVNVAWPFSTAAPIAAPGMIETFGAASSACCAALEKTPRSVRWMNSCRSCSLSSG